VPAGVDAVSGWMRDFGYSLRRLSRSPGFTLTSILLLGLALAANACVFAIFYCLLHKPLPYHESNRLVNVVPHLIKENWDIMLEPRHIAVFSHLPDIFDRYGGFGRNLEWLQNGPDAEPTRLQMVFIEPVVFELLGLQPLAGRLPGAGDVGVRNPGRAWVSARFAEEHFGGPNGAIGATLALRYDRYQIAGVLRPNALFSTTQLWIPVTYTTAALAASVDLSYGRATGIGRLAPGMSRDEASRRLSVLINALPEVRDDPVHGNLRITAASLRTLWSDRSWIQVLQLLMATALVIMLITAFNVSNLYLARLAARRHESALIAALGAESGRLMRLHCMDAAILSACGLALGLLLAPSGLTLLRYFDLLPEISPYPIGVDRMTVVFAVAIALMILGALVGSALWLQRRSGPIQDVLKEAGNRQSGGRSIRFARIALTVGQVSLTITLLVGAGLLIRSAERVLHEDMGFDRNHLVMTGVSLAADPVTYEQVVRRLYERVAKLPGVLGATVAGCNPINGNSGTASTYQPIDTADPDTSRWPTMTYCSDTEFNYFSVMGVRLTAGRSFTADEARSHAAVAIVDQRFVRRNFPTGLALGRTITIKVALNSAPDAVASQHTKRSLTIVGVVPNIKSLGSFVGIEDDPAVYTPGEEGSALLIRSSVALPALQHALKSALHEVSPRAMLGDTTLADGRLADFVHYRYPLNDLLKALSVATLVLASVGLYAVLAYSVRMRTKEFGVRLALGESAARLRRDVVVQGLRWAGIGALIAMPLVWTLSRVLASQLYRVAPLDPLTLLAVLLIVGSVSFLASWWPARVASQVDPLSVLRAE
jgi:putative ABC transport system permease protein